MHPLRKTDRTLRRTRLPILLLLLAALTLQGCGNTDTKPSTTKPAPAADQVILSTDGPATGIYPVEADPTLASGAVTFTVDNPGKSERGAQLVRVDTGHSAADAFEALKKVGDGEPMPTWLAWAGGVGVTRPGQAYTFSVVLEPGTYYAIDRSFEGRSSDFENLDDQAQITVVAAEQPAPLPATTGSITATKDGFETDALNAGARTVLLDNETTQPHNFVVSPILAGKTLDDVKAFATSDDDSVPPPVDLEREIVSGTLAAGMQQTLGLDLTAGSYALLCFASDAAGGPPHIVTGETYEVKVL